MTWTCATCGRTHESLPMCFGAEAPWRLLGVAETEFEARVELNADLCVVDGAHFFIRGHIEIPVRGLDVPFAWSVWCSLSEASFLHVNERWHAPDRGDDAPYFGWLCTRLPTYPDTLNLRARVQSRQLSQVPAVRLEPTDHPLAVEQREGMDMNRLAEIAHAVLGEL